MAKSLKKCNERRFNKKQLLRKYRLRQGKSAKHYVRSPHLLPIIKIYL